MRINRKILISIEMLIIILLLFVFGENCRSFRADLPSMPLIAAWMEDGKEKMPILSHQTYHFSKILPGIDWRIADILTFDAVMTKQGEIACNIGYDVFDDGDRKLFFISNDHVLSRDISVITDGWPYLIDNDSMVAALFFQTEGGIQQPGIIRRLIRRNDDIDFIELTDKSLYKTTYRLAVYRNPNTNERFIINRLDGAVLAKSPPKGEYNIKQIVADRIVMVKADDQYKNEALNTDITWAIYST